MTRSFLDMKQAETLQTIKSATDLDLLTAVEQGEVVSQAALSKRIGVAVGLVNSLLKRAVGKGYVKVRQVPRKRFAYYLTPTGFVEKSRLVAEYLECSFDLYRQAKEEYAAFYQQAKLLDGGRIFLVGGGDLAEIAVLVSKVEGVQIEAIVMPGSNLGSFLDIPVVPGVEGLRGDECVVITDIKNPQETYDRLAVTFDPDNIMAPDFLRILRSQIRVPAAGDGE